MRPKDMVGITVLQKRSPRASLVVGCGPTGPVVDGERLEPNAVIDVALREAFAGWCTTWCIKEEECRCQPHGKEEPGDHCIILFPDMGECTVLACLAPNGCISIEKRLALGSRRSKAVLDFGAEGERLGFAPSSRSSDGVITQRGMSPHHLRFECFSRCAV